VPYAAGVSHLIELFYSEHCFGCPEARRLLERFASDHPDVVVVARDIDDDAAYRLATDYGLIATPAFVIDRSSIIYGIPRPETLALRISASAPVVA
jgi:thiol-disulfide isomerase/thioredoxin